MKGLGANEMKLLSRVDLEAAEGVAEPRKAK